jgi:thioesterase domain-containing protein
MAFNYLDIDEVHDESGTRLSLNIMKIPPGINPSPDLSLTVYAGELTFAVNISYFSELFEPSSIIRFSEQWLSHLQCMAFNPQERMADSVATTARQCQPRAEGSPPLPLDWRHGLDISGTHSGDSPKRIWLLNKGTEGAPLFCLYGLGGMVTPYRALGRYLEPRPVYGIEALGLQGLTKPEDSIALMAETALKALREIQPEGPYFLCGWSMGGWIATEIARTLVEQGEEVRPLGLFDPPLIEKPHLLNNIKRGFAGQIMGKAVEHWGGVSERRIYQALLAYGAIDETDDGLARRIKTLVESHRKALDNYVPRIYPGPVVYWQLAGRATNPLWRHWFPDLYVENTSGNHFSMLREPAVSTLASSLRGHLSRPSQAPQGVTGLA